MACLPPQQPASSDKEQGQCQALTTLQGHDAGHLAHVGQAVPYLFLLACPLMHMFHGHGHHGHGHAGHKYPDTREQQPSVNGTGRRVLALLGLPGGTGPLDCGSLRYPQIGPYVPA